MARAERPALVCPRHRPAAEPARPRPAVEHTGIIRNRVRRRPLSRAAERDR